jgi:FAR-17a/AIG1-like protein.
MFFREGFPKDDKEARRVVDKILYPSASPWVFLFVALQVQHTIGPLAPWLELYLWPEPPYFSLLTDLAMLLVAAAAYLGWAVGLTWHMRGVPPYPVMGAAWRDGIGAWLPLYAFVIMSGLAITCLRHACAPSAF